MLKGKFYRHIDGSGGHPSLIYDKNDNKDVYKAVLFTHAKKSGRTKLKHNIKENDKGDTYVHNTPIIEKRKNFLPKEMKNLKIHRDDKPLINKIKRKK